MRSTRSVIAIALVAAGSTAGCGFNPFGSSNASWLRADISAAIVSAASDAAAATAGERYNGNAEFNTGTPGPGRTQFHITSYGLASSEGQSFALTRWDGGRLGVGTWQLTHPDLRHDAPGMPTGILLQYFRRDAAHEEQFVAESGTVVVTRSSRSRVEGSFVFDGYRYCQLVVQPGVVMTDTSESCDITGTAPANAVRIQVSGTFSAVPLDVGTVVFSR